MIDLTPYTDANGDIDLKKELIQKIAGIVESGVTSGVRWVKFEDGTLIQEGVTNVALVNSRGTIAIPLPIPLIDTNGSISCNVNRINGSVSAEIDACVANAAMYNTGAFYIYAAYLRSVGQTYTLNISYQVIGRWK